MLTAFVYIQDLVPLLVFMGIVAAIWAFLSMVSNRNSKALDRLARLSRPQSLAEIDDLAKSKSQDRYSGIVDAAKALSSPLMPQTELEQSALKIKLANAGFRSDAAPMVYSGVRLACLGLLFLMSIAIFVPGRPLGFKTLQWVVIFTGVGFYLPSIVLVVAAPQTPGRDLSVAARRPGPPGRVRGKRPGPGCGHAESVR